MIRVNSIYSICVDGRNYNQSKNHSRDIGIFNIPKRNRAKQLFSPKGAKDAKDKPRPSA